MLMLTYSGGNLAILCPILNVIAKICFAHLCTKTSKKKLKIVYNNNNLRRFLGIPNFKVIVRCSPILIFHLLVSSLGNTLSVS